MSDETKALAKVEKDENGVVLAADFGDSAEGFENQTADDLSIPFIQVLQDNSPPVKKKSDKYVEGAEAGMLYNTVTKEIFSGEEGLPFQVCHVDHCYLEWWPRDSEQGKGFVARHEVDSEVVREAIALNNGNKFGKLPTEAGTELQETYSCWGIIPDPDGGEPDFAIVSFASKKIRPYKDWNTIVSKFTVLNPRTKKKQRPDRFAHLVRIKTVYKTDGKNDTDYYNVEIVPANGSVGASLQTPDTANYQAAKAFRDAILSGAAKANFESQEDGEDTESNPGF